jgi:tetratricopeptide (TPR) repeat protein
VALGQGDYVHARETYEESLAQYRALGDARGIAISLNNLGIISIEQGDYTEARRLIEENLALFRALGDKRSITLSLNNLGIVAIEQGGYTEARTLYEESLALCRELGDKRVITETLIGLVGLATATRQLARAARLAGVVESLIRALAIVLERLERGLYDTRVTTIRAQLDPETFTACWTEGQAISLEQAIAYAVEADDIDAPIPKSNQTSGEPETDAASA